jgi:ArsR family transcriptional regulator, virulence genes transcriptional regulator
MDANLEEKAKRRANFCSIFSNANRVMILWTLAGREMSVTEIAAAINTSLQNTSQHLSLMKAHDILSSRRDGQTIYYRIEKDHSEELCFLLHQVHQQEPVLSE